MNRIEELKLVISQAQAEINLIQEECTHPVSCTTKKYTGDTGNWDRYDDSWSIDLHCELCGKRWGYSYSRHDDYDNDKKGKRAKYMEASKKYTREIK